MQLTATQKYILIWCSFVIIIFITFIYAIPQFTTLVLKYIPYEWERSLGESSKRNEISKYKVCTRAKGRESLDKIVSKLKITDNLSSNKWNITIIQKSEVNAMALLDNNIIIYNGLIEQLDTPEELAGIIAHEIGHIVNNHPLKSVIRNRGLTFLFHLLLGDASDLGTLLIATVYSREAEKQADYTAMLILQNNNISTHGLKAFLNKTHNIEPQLNSGVSSYLSTHPSSIERSNSIIDNAYVATTPLISQDEFEELKKICYTDKEK